MNILLNTHKTELSSVSSLSRPHKPWSQVCDIPPSSRLPRCRLTGFCLLCSDAHFHLPPFLPHLPSICLLLHPQTDPPISAHFPPSGSSPSFSPRWPCHRPIPSVCLALPYPDSPPTTVHSIPTLLYLSWYLSLSAPPPPCLFLSVLFIAF